MNSSDTPESPRKRIKLSTETQTLTEPKSAELPSSAAIPTVLSYDRAAHAAKEVEVGITHYVSTSTPGFEGLLKKRYTDFLVNEILPNGRVVHLQRLGDAAVSQLDGNSQLAVTPEQNGTEAPFLGVSGSSAMISPPTTKIESSRADKEKAERPADQLVEEGTCPVGLLDLDFAFKLTHAPGFC